MNFVVIFSLPGRICRLVSRRTVASCLGWRLLPQSICLPFFVVSVTYNVISFLHHLTSLSNVHFHTFKISVTWFGVPSKYFSEIKICFKSGSIFCEKVWFLSLLRWVICACPYVWVSYMCWSIYLGELYVLVHISGVSYMCWSIYLYFVVLNLISLLLILPFRSRVSIRLCICLYVCVCLCVNSRPFMLCRCYRRWIGGGLISVRQYLLLAVSLIFRVVVGTGALIWYAGL